MDFGYNRPRRKIVRRQTLNASYVSQLVVITQQVENVAFLFVKDKLNLLIFIF